MLSEKSPQLPLEFPRTPGGETSGQPAVFRPIHYLGSKLRLAPAIADALDDADTTRGPVLDLFAGSGTTSLALAAHRQVIASDIQEYSRVICSALLTRRYDSEHLVSAFTARLQDGSPVAQALRTAVEPLVEFEQMALAEMHGGKADAICSVLEHGSLLAAERGVPSGPPGELNRRLTMVTQQLARVGLSGSPAATAIRYFGGAYFSYRQAVELDCMVAVFTEAFPAELRDIFTASLLSTASHVVNTVGKQFAQPIRPRGKDGSIKRHLLAKIQRDRQLDVQSSFLGWLGTYATHKAPRSGHVAVRADYREALAEFAGQCSVVYADPPYTRDHYSRFYHVLETLARRDNPEVARNPGATRQALSRGLYRDDRHQSPFCIKSQVAGAFRDLFELASSRGANMVVSYSPFESGAHPRLVQIDMLINLAREAYPSVELESVDGVSHSKLNHSSLNFDMPPEAEVLLVCRLKS